MSYILNNVPLSCREINKAETESELFMFLWIKLKKYVGVFLV